MLLLMPANYYVHINYCTIPEYIEITEADLNDLGVLYSRLKIMTWEFCIA